MTTVATPSATKQRPPGRAYIWAGLGACLLGLGLIAAQFFALKSLTTPWYSPTLATLGAFLLLVAVARRRTIPRLIALVLLTAFAGFQWYSLAVLMKLPVYEGPDLAGKPVPAFRATFADGRPCTEASFQDGHRHVLVFFRGRW